MDELLKIKLSIIKEISLITDNLSKATFNDDYDEINNILEKRQMLMKDADVINLKITEFEDVEKISDKKLLSEIEKEINEELKKIIDKDSKIKIYLSKKEHEIRKKYLDIDLKIKTGSYDLEDSEKKPKGYFLNTNN